MTPEKQRIAIAEACGWTVFEDPRDNFGHRYNAPSGASPFLGRHALPDYLVDLNAMHEAEKLLPANLQAPYLGYLADFCEGKPEGEITGWAYHATAAQRAEAFLRTLGLWEESK